MATATPTPRMAEATPPPRPHDPPLAPITVPMYTRILEAGILHGHRVYLWDGRLAPRMTTGRPHSVVVTECFIALHELRLPNYFVEQEQPMAFRLSHTAPCPDVRIVRGRRREFSRALPTTADVPLVVEVADSSLYEDRRLMQEYAREGIPVAWIVDVNGRAIEVYTLAGSNAYGPPTRYGEDAEIPVVVDGSEVARLAVKDLLP